MTTLEKRFSPTHLEADLNFLIKGISCHALLARIFPPREGLSVLEPCGASGTLGLWYAARGSSVSLLDIDPDALDYSKTLYRKAVEIGIDFPLRPLWYQGSIHKLPFGDNTFDFVFNEGGPQHWGYNPKDWRRQRSINEMVRVARVGAPVCVIANNALCTEIMAMANSVDHDYKGMPVREKPFTPEELRERLIKAGTERVNVVPVDSERFEDSRLIAGFGLKA